MADDEHVEEEEQNVYKENTREDMVENDEMTPQEEAFMRGYDEGNEPDDTSSEEKSEEEEKEE